MKKINLKVKKARDAVETVVDTIDKASRLMQEQSAAECDSLRLTIRDETATFRYYLFQLEEKLRGITQWMRREAKQIKYLLAAQVVVLTVIAGALLSQII